MESALYHFALLLFGKSVKIHGIAGNANCKLRIFFRMLISVNERFAPHYIDIEVLRSLCKITVKDRNKVCLSRLRVFSQCVRDNGEGV